MPRRLVGGIGSTTVITAVACGLLAAAELRAQAPAPRILPYEGRSDWAQMPAGRSWGAPSGVKMAPDGRSLWVLERCGDYSGPGCAESDLDPVLQFDLSGRLLRSFGGGMFVFPHGLFVDQQNNIWVVDGRGAEGKGHVVVKFSPEGRVLLTLGQRGVPGEGPNTLNRPSDVLVAPNGNIFVADGHTGMDTNMRIVKYAPDGTFIEQWGSKGSAPGQLDGAHGLAMDSRGRLFVADRENNRVQIFDQDGNFVDAWTQFGTPSGLFITPDDMLYVADYGAGIRIGSARDGRVTTFLAVPNWDTQEVRVGETLAVDASGVLYVGENANMKLMRFDPIR
jgi:DNA-binding beta-propeller fold protein YncE